MGREGLNLTKLALQHRAASCIQRAWRSHLFLSHLRCLDAASALMDSMAAMTLIPTLCLTLLSARMLGLASQRKAGCLPMQCLQWGYMSTDGGLSQLCSHPRCTAHLTADRAPKLRRHVCPLNRNRTALSSCRCRVVSARRQCSGRCTQMAWMRNTSGTMGTCQCAGTSSDAQ